jgi:hypothetical protein
MVLHQPKAWGEGVMMAARRIGRAALLLALLVSGIALIDRGDADVLTRDDSLGRLASLPGRVEAVIVIRDAAGQRNSDAGRALASMLVESGLMRLTALGWRDLADELGWSEVEAFDRLLGRRVMLVAEGLGPGETFRWALLCDVDRQAELRIRRRLKAAPRGIIQNHPVLAVEDGRFQLAFGRRSARSLNGDRLGSGRWNGGGTLLLAPAEFSDLFDALLPALDGASDEGGFGQTETFSHARRIGMGDMLAVVRLPIQYAGRLIDASPEATGEPFAVVRADHGVRGWHATIASSEGVLWKAHEDDPALITSEEVNPWSGTLFDRIPYAPTMGLDVSADSLAGVAGFLHRDDVSGGAGGEPMDGDRLSMGVVRPGELASVLSSGEDTPGNDLIRSLRWINTITWDARRSGPGVVDARVTVEMLTPMIAPSGEASRPNSSPPEG